MGGARELGIFFAHTAAHALQSDEGGQAFTHQMIPLMNIRLQRFE